MPRRGGTNLNNITLEFPDEQDKLEIVDVVDDDIDNDDSEDVDAETNEQEETEEGDSVEDQDDDTDGDSDVDDFTKDALKQYQERMASIGGRFDSAGKLVFDAPQIVEPDYIDPDVATEMKFTRMVAPMVADAAIAEVTRKMPVMVQYIDDVKAILKGLDPAGINPQVVESYFFYVRGQKADLEIAKTIKSRDLKIKDRQLRGNAAAVASEPSGKRVTKPKSVAKIDKETDFFAKSLGIDPQELANNVSAARGGRR